MKKNTISSLSAKVKSALTIQDPAARDYLESRKLNDARDEHKTPKKKQTSKRTSKMMESKKIPSTISIESESETTYITASTCSMAESASSLMLDASSCSHESANSLKSQRLSDRISQSRRRLRQASKAQKRSSSKLIEKENPISEIDICWGDIDEEGLIE